MTDYKLTEEYRERFALNKGERYWIEQALEHYTREAETHVAGPDNGNVIASGYFTQVFKDISSKLDCWTE